MFLVSLLCFFVNLLLLLGTNRLCACPFRAGRAALGAALGAVYAGLCLIPGMAFLGMPLWRLLSLLAMGLTAFGLRKNAVRQLLVFGLLTMAVGGMAMTLGAKSGWGLLGAAVCICVVAVAGLRGQPGRQRFVPVELTHGGKHLRITALEDTGNTLRDPVTGKPVLVVSAQVAQQLIGLSGEQLRKPVESMTLIPGLRLIPYRTVDGQGLLLGLRIGQVRIGDQKGSGIVAFAPEGLDGQYQALTGGMT